MHAVFHCEQDDGTIIAVCTSFPDWEHHSPSLAESRATAEGLLRDHIVATTTFDHLLVPRENTALRGVA